MDILDKILDKIQSALGPDVFTQELAESLERQFRFDYGGNETYIASLRAMEVSQRHCEVRRLIRSGLSNAEISERCGISKKHAWTIRQSMTLPTSGGKGNGAAL